MIKHILLSAAASLLLLPFAANAAPGDPAEKPAPVEKAKPAKHKHKDKDKKKDEHKKDEKDGAKKPH